MRTCDYGGCNRTHMARGYCVRHYKRLLRNGTPQGKHSEHGETFWPRLHRKTVVDANGCWIWQGARTAGYGSIGINGKTEYVHRWVYETVVGEAPEEIDHLCRNRACCNPFHLEAVSHRENARRSPLVSRLNPDRVREIRRLRTAGMSGPKIARVMGVENTIVYGVIHGQRWEDVD